MVKWYTCNRCNKTIDEFDLQYVSTCNICKNCLVTKETKTYPAQIGIMSLVGFTITKDTKFPLEYGNYMSIHNGPYIINMWAENFERFVKDNDIKDIEVTIFSHKRHNIGLITDKRIPKEWLNNKLCVTGHGWGSRILCETVCQFADADIKNRICGCEKFDEAPNISIKCGYNIPTVYKCLLCGHEWK